MIAQPTTKTALCILDNEVLVQTDHALYSGWRRAPEFTLEKEPLIKWKKALLPYEIWQQCVSFLRWSQRTHHEEAMMTFFYNTTEDRWTVDVFPQRPAGMTVKLLEDHPDYKVVRAKYGSDWVQAGSIHHHCQMKAFQSGTDKDDESDRDGIHITLGNMNDAVLDVHIRAVFGGVTYPTVLAHWIETPDWAKIVPLYVWKNSATMANAMYLAIDESPAFPDEWKERIIKWQPHGQTVLTQHDGQMSMYGGNEWGYGYGDYYDRHDDTTPKKNGSDTKADTAAHSTTTSTAPHDAKAFQLLSDISQRLGLTFQEIYDVIVINDGEVQEMKIAGLFDEEDMMMRNAVLDCLKKEGFAPLYIEALLERVL